MRLDIANHCSYFFRQLANVIYAYRIDNFGVEIEIMVTDDVAHTQSRASIRCQDTG